MNPAGAGLRPLLDNLPRLTPGLFSYLGIAFLRAALSPKIVSKTCPKASCPASFRRQLITANSKKEHGMEYETRHDLSAHQNMKRSREARRLIKLFVEACASFGLHLEGQKVSLGWTRDYLYFSERRTGLSACLEVSTYKVKSGTNYSLWLHTPDAPDGRTAPGESTKKEGHCHCASST